MKLAYAIALGALAITSPIAAKAPAGKGWSKINEDAQLDHWIRDKDWMSGRPETESALVWVWVDHKRSRSVSHELILLEINCPRVTRHYARVAAHRAACGRGQPAEHSART